MKKLRKLSKKFIMPMTAMFVLAGCQNMDEYREERIAKADRAFKEIKSKKLPKDAIMSLPYCIETALTNNLNMRVYDLKIAMNNEKRTAAALGMLPDVIVTNDISDRNNQPGASSYSLQSGQMSLEPSQSSEKWENRVRVEFLFSFIDFGLAYFNAVQAKDRAIITQEEKRRAAQNLILDVSRAYFKVAAAQYAMEHTEKMLSIADETEKLLEEMVKNKKLPLEKIVTEKKTFLILKKSLMEYKRSYENSCIELRALMGYYPTHELSVDTTGMRELADLKVPDIELLEEIALLERPELFQLDIQQHITAISAKKKIIEMFPNVGIFTDFTNSTNKYLYNQSWWELGARAAYRLLRVPQQIGEFAAIETEIDQIKAQVTALSVGILSQVRIAHANLMEVKSRYQLTEELYDAYLKHEEIKEKQAKNGGSISKIELNRIKMETAQKDIERTQALGNYYLAYFRLLNSVGLETLDSKTLEDVKARIHENFKNTQEEELESIGEYKECIAEYQAKIDKLNKKREEILASIATIEGNNTSASNKTNDLTNEMNSKVQEMQNSFAKSLAALESELSSYKNRLSEADNSLAQAKSDHTSKVAEIERQYKQSLASANSEDEAAVEQIEESYDLNKNNADKDYEEICDSIEQKKDEYNDKINDLTDRIADAKDDNEDKVADIKENYEDKIADASDIKGAGNLKDLQAEAKEYSAEIAELEKEKASVEDMLKQSKDSINNHSNKLEKYVAAIDMMKNKTQLPSALAENNIQVKDAVAKAAPLAPANQSGEAAVSGDAPTAEDNLNMESQEQSDDSNVSFLEYDPNAVKNIDMETQNNSRDNDISLMGYDPNTQKDINMQTMSDAGNDNINFQEYGSELETGDESIGSASQNNAVDNQLNKSLTD